MSNNEIISLIIAICSILATCIAAYAAWKGPIVAVQVAENLRRSSDTARETYLAKQRVFETLMKERATPHSKDAAGAFNAIDVIFNDCETVREAWAEYVLSLDRSRKVSYADQVIRFRNLLREMAINIGLSDKLRISDFERVYYPDAIAEEDHIKLFQRKEMIKND